MAEAITTTVLEDVVVLSIGRNTEAAPAAGTPASGTPTPAPRPSGGTSATLMVTPEEARKLELAKAQGRISLVLRNPLDRSVAPDSEPATAETIDPMLATMGARRMQARMAPGMAGSLRDRAAWNKLIGGAGAMDEAPKPAPPPKKEEKKEPPKPRAVVDVYRGDKHVQEIFQ
jgi:Flp pilus assembly protein CpaB